MMTTIRPGSKIQIAISDTTMYADVAAVVEGGSITVRCPYLSRDLVAFRRFMVC